MEKAGHGFEQRLRLGIDARVGENTNITVLGSATGMNGVDTEYDTGESRGLNRQRLEKAEVTQKAKQWDFTAGRLSEPMGATGYWFGKEYDGGRAVWTNNKTQVRLGYGDFSHSTGITDSAYTHATKQVFFRSPTKNEWLGYNSQLLHHTLQGIYKNGVVDVDGYSGLLQKLAQAGSLEQQQQIVTQYLDVIKQNDPDTYNKVTSGGTTFALNTFAWKKVTVKDLTGTVIGEYIAMASPSQSEKIYFTDYFNQTKLEAAAQTVWDRISPNLETNTVETAKQVNANQSFLLPAGKYTFESEFLGYGEYTGNQIMGALKTDAYAVAAEQVSLSNDFNWFTKAEAEQKAVTSLWDKNTGLFSSVAWKQTSAATTNSYTGYSMNGPVSNVIERLLDIIGDNWEPEDNSSLPLTLLEELGEILPQEGTVLVQDRIPAIDTAVFAQVKQQLSDNLGLQAWYLRSVKDKKHSLVVANGNSNDLYEFDQLANIIGVGAKWKINDQITFSYDLGRNLTDFGKFMNGNTVYNHPAGTSDFTIAGREAGGTPQFWVARVDIGRSDTERPGSWNAFADYKQFDHGAFFGGNGTEGVPDRYLDGIRSFTVGAGYVPAKDFLLEAFYTFDAKGTGKRDTLYGAENFKLGDYARMQLTYKF